MKAQTIDLNKWEKVSSEEDITGYKGLVIIPIKMPDGTKPPNLFFRQGDPRSDDIIDTDSVIWTKKSSISNKGSQEEYNKRVDWWFSNAENDIEYKGIINDTFNKYGFNVKMSWEKAKAWLKNCIPSDRKTNIHKYVWNWLTKGFQWQLNRIEKNGKTT